MNSESSNVTRRNFIKASAAVSLAAIANPAKYAFAAGSSELKIGLVGCGFRGTGATVQSLTCSDKPVKLWAMGDLFADKVESSYVFLQKGSARRYDLEAFTSLSNKMDIPKERKFSGFDAYQKVIDSGVDIVILAEPPHFRPKHFKAAIEAGKHVFMEKPVAVDPAGVRSVIETAELAKTKSLSVVAGTQRRHCNHYIEMMKRIHDGEIGEIVGGQFHWNCAGGYILVERKPGWSDMEWQIRNWGSFNWLSGDHIVEQHVHNLDIMMWAMQSTPVKVIGIGGRAALKDKGNNYDHFAVEFEFENGVTCLSMCAQQPGTSSKVTDRIVGTKGTAHTVKWGNDSFVNGKKYAGVVNNPYIQEHADLIDSIVKGKPINEARPIAESTMAGIVGRMSAYTGRAMKWRWAMKASKLDYSLEKYELGDKAVEPVAIPGITKLV